MVSANCKHGYVYAPLYMGLFTFALSHSDLAYICVLWEEQDDSRRPFNHILRSRRHCHLGSKHKANPSVPKILFV
jgi:hypothetical protein